MAGLGIPIVLIFLLAKCQCQDLMSKDEIPDPGISSPETVYQPGEPGANWTPEEIDSTRERLLKALTPIWPEKYILYDVTEWNGADTTGLGEFNENVLMRLAFHDCLPYLNAEEEDRACDGCLDFNGMFNEQKQWFNSDHIYKFPRPTTTDNFLLGTAAITLEKIYKSIDWPFTAPFNPDLTKSLYQSGKSRADLWQFAGMVALERTIERANRACDLDFHIRQQITILESREACEIKLDESALKFVTGRIDCNNVNEVLECVSEEDITEHGLEDAGFITCKHENHPELMGDGKHLVDFGREVMNVDADKWMALQAIHGVVHSVSIGTKYTWFGSGYLGNTYFKLIANKPTYRQNSYIAGDLSFTDCLNSNQVECTEATINSGKCDPDNPGEGNAIGIKNFAVGDTLGNPIPMTGWRVSCGFVWDTPEGGPCILRPVLPECPGSPVWDEVSGRTKWDEPAKRGDTSNPGTLSSNCGTKSEGYIGDPMADWDWKHGESSYSQCSNAEIKVDNTVARGDNPFNLLINGKSQRPKDLKLDSDYWKKPDGPSDATYEKLSSTTQTRISSCAWSNQLAFPWEVGMYWNFTVGGDSHRPQGCAGLDDYEYGIVNGEEITDWNSHWPFRRTDDKSTEDHRWGWTASPAMRCGKNEETDSQTGQKFHEIVDELADDNTIFSKKFLEGWHQMITNGYNDSDLVDAPDNGWLGHYSLTQQGKTEHLDMKFEDFIKENRPVTFTDPNADPYICGHRGHFTTSCGITFNQLWKIASKPHANSCSMQPCSLKGECD